MADRSNSERLGVSVTDRQTYGQMDICNSRVAFASEKAVDMIYSFFLTFHDLLFGNSFWKKLYYLSYKNYKSELKL